jgi:hypothetical protein
MIMARPQPTAHSPTVMEQYELLRAAMLGAALPPDSRTGLIVLLHRGMWAWGTHDRPRSCPAKINPGFLGPPVESGRTMRTARGRPPARRHGYDDH